MDILETGSNVDVKAVQLEALQTKVLFSNWGEKLPLSKHSYKSALMFVCDGNVVTFMLLFCSSVQLLQLLNMRLAFASLVATSEDERSSYQPLISLSNSGVINQLYSLNPSGIETEPPMSPLCF